MTVGDPYAPQQPPRKSHVVRWIFGGVAIFLLALCIFGTAYNFTKAARDSGGQPVLVLPSDDATSAAPKPTVPSIGDGVWAIGGDVKPGRYRLAVAPENGCYWAITRDDAGQDIVANDLPTGGHPQVTLKKGQFFTTRDCGTWTLLK